jgi:type IV secretion system protein VirB10
MSGTAPVPTPQAAPSIMAPSVVAGPGRKVLIVGCSIIAVLGAGYMFSGRQIPFMHHDQPSERPIEVQMNGPITRLDKPAEQLPRVARPAIVDKALARAMGGNNDSAKAAAESSLVAFSLTGSANGAPAPTTKPGSTDPDGLPLANQPDALESSLKPTRITGTRVSELPDPTWLITQGRVLPCTQQTAIDSSLPGAVTAITSEPIRGEAGDVVLIPKGARVFGTVQHSLMNGLDRLAVVWQSISWQLPDNQGLLHLYRIETDSPASSVLGETGLDGDIDHHYLKKIGGILGMSLVQGGIQYGVAKAQSSGQGNTSVNLDSFQQGGNEAANALLQSWVAIPDVMHRNQGLACSIFVVRDLDFRGIYQLKVRQ